jgi:hypothetical protein
MHGYVYRAPVWIVRAFGHIRGQDNISMEVKGSVGDMLTVVCRLKKIGYTLVKGLRTGEKEMH